jgi:FixJ family two-component response regulator
MATMVKNGHVFLVDDDSDIRIHLGNMLRQLGYAASEYSNATEFLNSVKPVSPAVLVLDMRMPFMSGVELQNSLHSRGWHLPIIFMSGESQNQEIIDAMKNGALDFLWKPFSYKQLIEVIDRGIHIDKVRATKKSHVDKVSNLFQELSEKEKTMFKLILSGHSNKAIALSTGLMSDTVKKHRAQIFAKMQVQSLAELIEFCNGFSIP